MSECFLVHRQITCHIQHSTLSTLKRKKLFNHNNISIATYHINLHLSPTQENIPIQQTRMLLQVNFSILPYLFARGLHLMLTKCHCIKQYKWKGYKLFFLFFSSSAPDCHSDKTCLISPLGRLRPNQTTCCITYNTVHYLLKRPCISNISYHVNVNVKISLSLSLSPQCKKISFLQTGKVILLGSYFILSCSQLACILILKGCIDTRNYFHDQIFFLP